MKVEKLPKKMTNWVVIREDRKLTMMVTGLRWTPWCRMRRGRGATLRRRASLSVGFGGGSNVIEPWHLFA